jgi:hypothetical protein
MGYGFHLIIKRTFLNREKLNNNLYKRLKENIKDMSNVNMTKVVVKGVVLPVVCIVLIVLAPFAANGLLFV